MSTGSTWESTLETVAVQHRRASFSRYYPTRTNGWGPHRLVFSSNTEEISTTSSHAVFKYNEANGDVEVVDSNYLLKIEFWWKGRAPWGYHYVYIIKNLPVCPDTFEMTMPNGNECGLSSEDCKQKHKTVHDIGHVCCGQTGYYFSSNGHVICVGLSKQGDRFSLINLPAHIQGTPGIFELRVSAYLPRPAKALEDSLAQVKEFLEMIHNDSHPDEVERYLCSKAYSLTHKNNEIGLTAIELLMSKENDYYSDKPEIFRKMKDLLCVNSFSHVAFDISKPHISSSPLCWQCKANVEPPREQIETSERNRVLREDESLFGPGIQSNPPNEAYEKASLAALERGVDVKWLERFTDMHNCWSWPTWYKYFILVLLIFILFLWT